MDTGDRTVGRGDRSTETGVESRTEPFFSFAEIEGQSEQKEQLHRQVVEPSTHNLFSTTSVLLLDTNCHGDWNTQLAKGLTGELGSEFTFFYVDSLGGLHEHDSVIEDTLRRAVEQEPSLVIVDCLDEFWFGDDEYEILERYIETLQTGEERVIVVCTATDGDGRLAEYNHIFERTVRSSAPDGQFRLGIIEERLATAREDGLITYSAETLDLESVADSTDGFTVTELTTVVKRTIQRRMSEVDDGTTVVIETDHLDRSIEALKEERIELDHSFFDFDEPDARQGSESVVPDVTFDDIGGLTDEKQRLKETVFTSIEHRDAFREAGYPVGRGILLYGPPGNGKTMLASAVANETGYYFIPVKGSELERPYVGESEAQVRNVFQEAREHAPSIIFFDEFDAIAPARNTHWGHPVKDDIVNTLLSELDGVDPLHDVIVIAATNRVEIVDEAAIRSGRFDTFLEVTPPNATEREEIFGVCAENLPLTDDVTSDWFGGLALEGVTGADIASICREAFELAVREHDRSSSDTIAVSRNHVETAIERIRTDPTGSRFQPEFY